MVASCSPGVGLSSAEEGGGVGGGEGFQGAEEGFFAPILQGHRGGLAGVDFAGEDAGVPVEVFARLGIGKMDVEGGAAGDVGFGPDVFFGGVVGGDDWAA